MLICAEPSCRTCQINLLPLFIQSVLYCSAYGIADWRSQSIVSDWRKVPVDVPIVSARHRAIYTDRVPA